MQVFGATEVIWCAGVVLTMAFAAVMVLRYDNLWGRVMVQVSKIQKKLM